MSVVSMLLSLLSATAVDLEGAFLQNRPELLLRHLSTRSRLSLTLPEPIGFSDLLSAEQAYFFLHDLGDKLITQEFYLEDGLPERLDRDRLILKARWSVRDKRTDDRTAFRLFFFVRLEKPLARAGQGRGGKPETGGTNPWKVLEIKAERI